MVKEDKLFAIASYVRCLHDQDETGSKKIKDVVPNWKEVVKRVEMFAAYYERESKSVFNRTPQQRKRRLLRRHNNQRDQLDI